MKSAIATVGKSLLAAVTIISATATVVAAGDTSAAAAIQATYYVAPDGDDTNPGTLTAPLSACLRWSDVDGVAA